MFLDITSQAGKIEVIPAIMTEELNGNRLLSISALKLSEEQIQRTDAFYFL